MAGLTDISVRTAAKIGMDPVDVQRYVDTLMTIVREVRSRGEDIELMTFGTLRFADQRHDFRAHSSLQPPDEEEL